MFFVILFTTFWVIFLFHQLYWRRRNLPPGPFPLPIIGNIHQIDTQNLEKQLLKWKKQYGNVFTVWMPDPQIIASDSTVLKEFVTNGDAYAGRPIFNLMKLMLDGNYGLAFNYDSFWRSQRRFALHVLRDFGFGKPILENAIISQANEMETYLKKRSGQSIDITHPITTSVGNIIHQLTFGWITCIESNDIIDFRDKTLKALDIFLHPFGMLLEYWIGFQYLDPLFNNMLKRCIKYNDEVVKYVKDEITKHRKTIDYNSDPRDYIDAFLIEQRRQNGDIHGYDEWSDRQLIVSAFDLFTAGLETTSTTLRIFILYLIRHPDIQKKIHQEIDKNIGRDRTITMNEQKELPYLQACIQEIQRVSVLVSINLPHRTTKNVSMDEFQLPKGITIIPQFQSVHLDDEVFDKPESFIPERHIDENGKYIKDDRITPFSIGKRSCLGESLARMELFIFSATLLQKFQFLPENDGELPEIKYVDNFVRTPVPFNCRVIPRT